MGIMLKLSIAEVFTGEPLVVRAKPYDRQNPVEVMGPVGMVFVRDIRPGHVNFFVTPEFTEMTYRVPSRALVEYLGGSRRMFGAFFRVVRAGSVERLWVVGLHAEVLVIEERVEVPPIVVKPFGLAG